MYRKARAAVLFFILVQILAWTCSAQSKSAAFHPGTPWLDTAGVPINAHGGGIVEQNGTYYWFGEKRTGSTSEGVSVYSSRDLYMWQDRGLALSVDGADADSEIARGCVIERPKVLFNKKRG